MKNVSIMTNSKKILKNKKGLIALVLTGAMLLSLTACAGKKDWDDTNESVQPDVTQGNTIEADASFTIRIMEASVVSSPTLVASHLI